MLSALGPLLPIAVAVAVSTVPIMATILILLSPKRNRSAIPFLIGWVVGMAAVVVVAGVRGQCPPDRIFSRAAEGDRYRSDRRRDCSARRRGDDLATGDPSTSGAGNGWLDRVERMGPVAALGFALALNLRPKALLLGAAAGLSVAGSSLRTTGGHRPGHLRWSLVLHGHRSDRCDARRAGSDAASPRSGPRLAQPEQRHITVVVLVMVGFVILGAGISQL